MDIINIAYIISLAGVWVAMFMQLKGFSHKQRKQFTLLSIMVAVWMSIGTMAQLKQNGI